MDERFWGVVDPEELRRLVVLSPHFDDAAMGAGHIVASHPEVTVVTVMGGPPPKYPEEPSPWDALGGFRAGDDVVAIRREEDRRAMEVLEATPHWLEFPDHQYLAPEERPTPDDIVPVLEAAILEHRPTAVFAPMGLANPDHDVTHNAAMLVRQRHEELAWYCYEDHGYKHLPGLLAWRVARLLRHGPWPTPAIVPHHEDEARKRRAVWSYTSQLRPLEQDHALSKRMDALVPEQFWRLAPPPEGWGPLSDLI